MSYTKYYVYKKQYTTDGTTWADVVPAEWTPSGDPIGTYDTFQQCGENPPQYRAISGTPYCNGTNKYVNTFAVISYDNGSTWEPAVPSSATVLLETTSMDCFKLYATRDFSPSVHTVQCNGNPTIEKGTTYSDIITAVIGNCVTSIGASAFTSFSSLTTVNISNNVTSIGNYAFYQCHNLANINIPSGLTSIGNYAFGSCTSLTGLTLPSTITSIGERAFVWCGNFFKSLTCLATTPPTLGSQAFYGTDNCSIYVPCDSIVAYKTASGWSDYASGIYPIPDTCTTQYRWIADCWECQGYDKWNKSKQQVSTDGGQTWTDTGVVSATTLEEANSFSCGYGDSNPTSHYYYAEYSDGRRYAYDTDCDYELTSAEANPACYDSTKMTYAYVGGCYDEIGMGAFYEDTSLSSVTINGIRYIGNSAFQNCTSLTSVTLPNVSSIGWDAFKNCTSLQYIAIKAYTPPTLSSLGGVFVNTNNCPIYVPAERLSAYNSASGWTSYAGRIQAPPSVTLYRWADVGDFACVGYDKYNALTQQVSYDSGYTWQNTSTTSATTLIETNSQDCGYLPSNVKYYFVGSGDNRYSGACNSNTTLSGVSYYSGVTLQAFVGDCVTAIGNSCFESFTNLNKVSIPSGVTSIGNYAFLNCSSLTSVEIPSGVTAISNSTFGGCGGLTSVTIPNSVTSIGGYAFSGCTSLTSIEIPSGITSIDTMTFAFCHSLTSITIPSGVTTIGYEAFDGCSGLTSIVIPDSVTSIGGAAFFGCSGLTSINIPSGVTSIGAHTFAGCNSLTSMDIPSGVTSIDSFAFWNCIRLTSITVNATTPPTLGDYNVFGNTNKCPIYVPSGSVETYKSASSWSEYASRIQAKPSPSTPIKFVSNYSNGVSYSANCDSNTTLTSGDTKPSGYNYADMTSIEIGDCIIEIGERAFFYYFNSLSSCTIGSGVTTIGEYAFAYCWSLTRLNSSTDGVFNIPSGVTSIGNSAFRGCSGLTSIEIPSGVTSIGNYAFQNCSGLTSIEIPSGVTAIGYNTFGDCSGLTSVTIPDSVTSISNGAFIRCSGLTSVDIPSGVTSIGQAAFYDCISLTSITINATTPPTLTYYVFDNTNDCPIYVPSESVETYKSASGWSDYASRIQAIP